jgi:hypothetical protein
MRFRYVIYYSAVMLTSLFLWYYVIVFCAVYSTTAISWLNLSILICLIRWLGIQILDPLFVMLSFYLNKLSAKFMYILFFI